MLCCCWTMRFWYWSFQSQMRFSSPARPTSWRVLPSSSSRRFLHHGLSGDAGVIGARQSTGRCRPSCGARRISRSCMTLSMAWPMCRAPVTLGNGIMMTYGFGLSSGNAANALSVSQRSKIRFSISAGSYCLGSSLGMEPPSFNSGTVVEAWLGHPPAAGGGGQTGVGKPRHSSPAETGAQLAKASQGRVHNAFTG